MNKLVDSFCVKKITEYIKTNAVLISMGGITLFAGGIACVPFYRIVLYLLVQYLVIYLCGVSIVEIVSFRFCSIQSKQFSAYAIGYCFFLIIYFLTLLISKPILSVIISLFLSIGNCFFRIKWKKVDTVSDFDGAKMGVVYIFFLLVSLVMFICFEAAKLSADVSGYVTMHCDDQFWFREAVEGTRGFPMRDYSAAGIIRCYHYFSGIWCSYLHYMTGIELYDICFSLSWVGDVFLLVGGVYVLFSESENISVLTLIIGFVAVLFTSTTQKSSYAYYLNHLYVSHFGYLPGAAMGTYVYELFLKWYRDINKNIGKLLICLSMFFVTLGLKAPCGCVVLAGIGTLCLISLVLCKTKKERGYYFLAGILFLLCYIVVYKCLFTYPNDDSLYNMVRSNDRFSMTKSLFTSGCFEPLKNALQSVFESKIIGYFMTYVIYWIASNFVLAVFLLVALIYCIAVKLPLKKEDIATIVMIIFGYIIYTIMYQNGYSNVYFVFAIFPYGIYFALDVIERCRIKERRRCISLIAMIVLGISLLCGLYKTCEYYIPNGILPGVKNMYHVFNDDVEIRGSSGNDANITEIEALRWLRDNSDENAIIATNLAIINHKAFTTSCYSERQAYIEGEEYGAASQKLKDYRYRVTEQYFLGSDEASEILIKEGVDYAVVFNSVEEYTQYVGDVIYENDAIKIIKLVK